jgi:hypothetical protein
MVATTNKSSPAQRVRLARTGKALMKNVLQSELMMLLQNCRATHGSHGQERFHWTLESPRLWMNG